MLLLTSAFKKEFKWTNQQASPTAALTTSKRNYKSHCKKPKVSPAGFSTPSITETQISFVTTKCASKHHKLRHLLLCMRTKVQTNFTTTVI